MTDLERFQATVLTALHDDPDPGAVIGAALADAPDAAIADWIRSWEPDLVVLAADLVRTWARRSPPG